MGKATDFLKEEHRLIERVIQVLERLAQGLQSGTLPPSGILEQILDFIRNFADRAHHGKEEDFLFPVLEGKGIPRYGGPIGVMLQEHETGRRLVRSMGEAFQQIQEGNSWAASRFATDALEWVQLLRQHIYKEDHILYPMADRVLTPAEDEQLLQQFHEADRQLGEGVRGAYEAMAGRLEAE